jgi:hypothetical protein
MTESAMPAEGRGVIEFKSRHGLVIPDRDALAHRADSG